MRSRFEELQELYKDHPGIEVKVYPRDELPRTMKVRVKSTGQPYYINEEPDENGIHKGTHKHTDVEAHLRWDDEKDDWVVVWEAEFDISKY